MLTGKAKIDFETWYLKMLRSKPEIQDRYWDENLLSFFWNSDDTIRNAYVFDWLESVKIYANHYAITSILYGYEVNFWGIQHINTDAIFNTRNKAVTSAIKKANEIYNTTH
ncbi:hypothetical protein [Chryseobacterium aureum]|uniref:hypothetical protein n=1 Tax=Chryseobacterium aureum TaxID=2497456 RepID=UPI000F875902|nr:hypothetical protein [Chryseobacterium aureum]